MQKLTKQGVADLSSMGPKHQHIYSFVSSELINGCEYLLSRCMCGKELKEQVSVVDDE